MIAKPGVDVKVSEFFVQTGLNLLEGRYRLEEEITGGKSSTAFFGVDEETGRQVFIKLAIFPRSELEKARFRNEARFLQSQEGLNEIIKKTPEYLSHGELFDGRILYLITERIEGQLLSAWFTENFEKCDLKERLLIAYRVFGASEYFGAFTNHRDLHPGNIILLDEPVDLRTDVPDFKTIILDWGQSYSRLEASYGGNADMITIHNGIGREITNSFYNLPPETFVDWSSPEFEYSKYDSWAMGLLLYKLVTGADLFSFDNIGRFAEAMKHIESEVDRGMYRIHSQADSKTNILDSLIRRLLTKDHRQRMSIQTARQVLWFILVEDFEPTDYRQTQIFLNNPYGFKGVRWKYFETDPLARIY
ncbi:hypothetical protein [Pseudomonas sp. PS01300]|uniref:protein kinase domain-containing protein n=1 Tax=Pseudomonas sp. PS01300 TaxID=2991436 RepID=UPI00249CA911|nr:hypothetical protein [Pseudomonas sp. PS01300]